MNVLFEVKGVNGTLKVYENKICIERTGFLARASVGTGTKEIFLKSITGMQIKPVTFLTRGYFQVLLSGSPEKRGRVSDLASDENTILFSKKSQDDFIKAKEKIESLIFN